MLFSKKDEFFHRYTVLYHSNSHWSVITQRLGSMWLQVLPFCLFNTFLMWFLTYLRVRKNKYEPYATAQGHRFLVLVVSYLLINRVKLTLARYNEERTRLQAMFRALQELIQNSIIWTAHCQDASSQEWRRELVYRGLIMLRCALAGIDYGSTNICCWQLPELEGFELDDVRASLYLPYDLVLTPGIPNATNTLATYNNSNGVTVISPRRWAHRRRTDFEENLRVGTRMAYLLRKTIHSQSKRLEHPFVITVENKLLSFVDAFMTGYYGIKVFLTTPVPFPWIQMSRTFTFLYVFTIPFVLITDNSSLLSHLCQVFVITFGFMGLEETAKELDDPFGKGENNYDNVAVAQTVFEDIYLTLANVDGPEAADIVRNKMREDKFRQENGSYDSATWLLDRMV